MIDRERTGWWQAPSPVARGLLALVALVATFSATSIVVLASAWLFVLVPLLLGSGVLKTHLRFVTLVVFPLFLLLIAIWGWLVAAPPGQSLGTDPVGGAVYAARISIRLVSVGAIFQLCFLPLPNEERLAMLCSWGLPPSVATAVIAAFALLPEMRRRANQISTAYQARGLSNRSWYSKAIGISTLLAPWVTWSLRAAHQREEVVWGQRPILKNFQEIALHNSPTRWRARDSLYVLVAGLYLAVMATSTLWGG